MINGTDSEKNDFFFRILLQVKKRRWDRDNDRKKKKKNVSLTAINWNFLKFIKIAVRFHFYFSPGNTTKMLSQLLKVEGSRGLLNARFCRSQNCFSCTKIACIHWQQITFINIQFLILIQLNKILNFKSLKSFKLLLSKFVHLYILLEAS